MFASRCHCLPGMVHVGTADADTLAERFLEAVNVHARFLFGGWARYYEDADGSIRLRHVNLIGAIATRNTANTGGKGFRTR